MKHEWTVTRTRELRRLPKWAEYALAGRKINAIKALRDTATRDDHDPHRVGSLGLLEAKRIVEEFLRGVIETEAEKHTP